MKRILALLALVGLAATAFSVEPGKPAPDFTAKDITGKTQKLSDYKGKIVVLESYNSDCPFCANHFKTGAMQELQADLTSKGVIWLMVNSVNPANSSYRTPKDAQKEWDNEKLKATAWIDDSNGKVGKLYDMKTTPQVFVIDKDGTLIYQGAIDDKPEASGDPRKANNYVRTTVNKLLGGEKVTPSQTKPYGCGVKY